MKWMLGLLMLFLPTLATAVNCDQEKGTAAHQRCWEARTKALIERSKNSAYVNCEQTGSCYLNNIDSTCYYADGRRSEICGQPDCAYGSVEYGTGSGSNRCGVCPPGSSRAGQPPLEGKCDVETVCTGPCCDGNCGGGPGAITQNPFFVIGPGESVSAPFPLSVPPGNPGNITATAKLDVAGDPAADLEGFLAAIAGFPRVISKGNDTGASAEELKQAMQNAIAAIKNGGTVTLNFETAGWFGTPPVCDGVTPPAPAVVAGDTLWGGGADSSVPGGSACGTYGRVSVLGTMKNAANPVNYTVIVLVPAQSLMADGCAGDSPLRAPDTSAPPEKGAVPTIQRVSAEPRQTACIEQTHPEPYECGTKDHPNTCFRTVHSSADGSLDTTVWRVTYLLSAPSVKVTDVQIDATGGGGLHFP